MHKRRSLRKGSSRRPDEHEGATVEARMSAKLAGPSAQPERLGPHYNAGPVHELSTPSPEPLAEGGPVASVSEEREEQAFSNVFEAEQEQEGGAQSEGVPAREVLPALEGEGQPTHAMDFNRRGPLRLHGRTEADFDGGSFRTENTTVQAGQGCSGCPPRQCVHVTGTLVATYSVQTSVTLPRVSDFPGLTPCQQRRVQDAIDNVLAPHEQQHVAAFETYNGTTRRAFDLNICRSQFDNTIRQMFLAEERARRGAARTASAALDPFHFDVDLECEEPQASLEGQAELAAAAEPPPPESAEEETPE